MLIERIDVRLLELPLVEPFAAAHGTTTVRRIVVVRIETDVGFGWGECSALPDPTYTSEFANGAFVVLAEHLAPRLLGRPVAPPANRSVGAVGGDTGAVDERGIGLVARDRPAARARAGAGAGAIGARMGGVVGHPMAKAALEMAVLDAELRRRGLSLGASLGVTAMRVKAGAAVGLGPAAEVTERVAALASEGFGRVKLKIEPGHDLAVVRMVRASCAGIEIQVDGNGAYGPEHLGLLTELAGAGIAAVEQPFAPDDRRSAAELAATVAVPIVADEAAHSAEIVESLHGDGALSGVSIKPPRLGGVDAAVDLHDWCVGHGVAATAGGMIECGLGRHALAAVAALPGFTVTGDLSPAGRWLGLDPWPDVIMISGEIVVPTGPGVAPDPDVELLERVTVHHTVVS